MYNENNFYDNQDNLENTNNSGENSMENQLEEPVYTYSIENYEEIKSEKDTKKNSGWKKVMKWTAGAFAFGMIAGLSFQSFNAIYDGFRKTPENQEVIEENTEGKPEETLSNSSVSSNPTALTTNTSSITGSDVSQVVENVMPSIVSINATMNITSNYFGQQFTQEMSGSGSGIIIGQNDKEVLIVTNNHVVNNANNVQIVFNDNSTANATIKGTEEGSDLAVVAVNLSDLSEETKASIKIATLGDSDSLKVGEMAIAIGNALGYGQSVTVGYISALNREVATEDYTMSLLQTDAAINPGNSGGALLNIKGEVIGINSVKYASSEVEGMGYAIPISYAIPIIEELMNREDIPESEQAYLGIIGRDVVESYNERYDMPLGVYVYQVSSDSPAEEAGLIAGDIITGFNGRKITNMSALQSSLANCRAGKEVTLTIQSFQDGEYIEKNLNVTLGNKPEQSASDNNRESERNSIRK